MLHEIIEKRYSPRAFADEAINDEQLISLLEAARWAPSSRNEQPWRFIVSRKEDQKNFRKLLETLKDTNKLWAENAAVLILTVAKLDSEFSHKPNIHALYDLGNSVAQLTFQATSMNLYIRQIGGFYEDKVRESFGIPENYSPVSVLAIGYKGDINVLPELLRAKETTERKRKEINEFVFAGKFGEPFDELKEINETKKAG